jgi:hypothetical protein
MSKKVETEILLADERKEDLSPDSILFELNFLKVRKLAKALR